MKAVTPAITLIFMSGLALLGKDKPRDWQEGTLIKITESRALHNYHFQPFFSPGDEGDNDTFIQYTIQFDGQFLIADATVSGLFANAIKPKETPALNSPIQFVIDKDSVYLKDKHGKEHKMHIEKRGVVANSQR